jgi:Alpha/beta hydrolase domain
MREMRIISLAALFTGTALAATFGGAVAQTISSPDASGPIPATALPGSPTHDYPFFSSDKDLAANGYVEEEYIIRGRANRYNITSLATGTAIDDHPYVTRVVVRRPADAKRFNGTAIVEWDNVTNNFDAENVWFWDSQYFIRSGYIWVGVSAQKLGVEYLHKWNSNRYGTLDVTDHGAVTDDALSYDIFSQVGAVLRHPGSVNVLGGLRPGRIIATGESQSAVRLVSYINAVHPLAKVFDGFVLLSPVGAIVRPDLISPVWKIQTEYDVTAADASLRTPDTEKLRSWEIAGTSHMDHQARQAREPLELRDTGISSETVIAQGCTYPDLGTRVPTTYVLSSAFDKIGRWVEGKSPSSAPRIEMASIASRPAKSVVSRDSAGMALGGIRLSQLSVPTAINVGINIGPGACERWGYSAPFDLATLNTRYPTHKAYVAAVVAQTKENLKHGFILPEDAASTIHDAEISHVGR